ncbi:hypothetical protein LTR85_000036 [Meristemomyces frigidus]|nr:hypothetical protein LTR85_000036 [Meristemomyces frigidus]
MTPRTSVSASSRSSTISPQSITPSTIATDIMVMNNVHMRDIFRCTDQELTDLKAAFKFQMEVNYVNSQPFLGQLPSEVDSDGEIRERMWGALMTSDRRFLEMLKGRRWGVDKPVDFDIRLKQAKNKICSDLKSEKRRRPRKAGRTEESINLASGEDSDMDVSASDRRLRKRRAVSYDLQQMRVFGGDEPPEGSVASTSQSSRQLRARPNMFGNVGMPLSAVDEESDDARMPSPEPLARLRLGSRSESPLFEPEDEPYDMLGYDGAPLLVSDLVADPRVTAARQGRTALSSQVGPERAGSVTIKSESHEDDDMFSQGPAPRYDGSNGSDIMVDATGYDGSRSSTSEYTAGIRSTSRSLRSRKIHQKHVVGPRRPELRPASQHDDESIDEGPAPKDDDSDGSDIVVATPSVASARATGRPTPSTMYSAPSTRSTSAMQSTRPAPPAQRQPLAVVVKEMVRLQIAEAETRIIARVDRKLAAIGRQGAEALKAEIREEVLEEIRREFE